MNEQQKLTKVSTSTIQDMKARGEKITMLTAYDYPTAIVVDKAGIDMILVGDSLGNVILGYDTTVPVTMDDMIHHTKAVARGANRALVIGDMPFMSYQASVTDAIYNAGRFLKETGAQAVKLEGGREVADTIRKIVDCGIPVMAHLGLTPQSVHQFGGFKVQGRTDTAAKKISEDAKIVQDAGAFAVVLECIPASLAKKITKSLHIPTIGIGAGVDCDGQVLVIHDMLGLFEEAVPRRFVKKYCDLYDQMKTAVEKYADEIKSGTFPDKDHSFK
ncbi:MAG: 3-methyl-2-oxobutanoate hydroxymethyltransferase [Deltaproteobacteria bacterium]|nr:3-methyl-2-oxobutanoate hydroxymethyltransferase [Deltaproteobacteria bacterium]